MSSRVFTNGFSLIVMLCVKKHEKAKIGDIQADILRYAAKEIKQSAIASCLNSLDSKALMSRIKSERKGELTSGQHGHVYEYQLTDAGLNSLTWMITTINNLTKATDLNLEEQ